MSNKKQKLQIEYSSPSIIMPPPGYSPMQQCNAAPSIIMPIPGYHPIQQCNAAPISLDSILEDRQNDVNK